jgi:hypothetical protein
MPPFVAVISPLSSLSSGLKSPERRRNSRPQGIHDFGNACATSGQRDYEGDAPSCLYGGIDEPGQKIIEVFICKLRKKLADASGGKNYIETIWGTDTCFATSTDEGSTRCQISGTASRLRSS